MLIEIDNKIISSEIFERKFVCDLSACKGACCVEGDAGAPLKNEEVLLLTKNIEKIIPYMRAEAFKRFNQTEFHAQMQKMKQQPV